MDIEELSKDQLLLLTVMVNFVVSIATGVLTVALLDQAPLTVTQGVNRVIDHTIQSIATPIQVTNPIRTVTAPITSALTPEKDEPTLEEQVTGAIATNAARSVLIHKNSTSTAAIAFGTYLPKSRAVVTAAASGLPKEAVIQFSNGEALRATISKTSKELVIYGFADDATPPSEPSAGAAESADLKQGQTVVALTKDSAALTGIISKVSAGVILTNLSGLPAGGAVTNLDGLIVGIATGNDGSLVSADTVATLLGSVDAK